MHNHKYIISIVFTVVTLFVSCKGPAQVNTETGSQISQLEKEKNSRTATEKKISSQLLQAIRASRGQNMADSVNLQPANVRVDTNGLVSIDINATVTDSLLANLKSLGAEVVFASVRFHSITAKVNLNTVETIAAYNDVKFIKPAAIAQTQGIVH